MLKDVYKRQFLHHSAFTSSDSASVIAVIMKPGAIALARMPREPSSCAIAVSYTHLDVYKRQEFTLRMPQLKDRREDILLFANFFLDQANRELDKHLIGFDRCV